MCVVLSKQFCASNSLTDCGVLRDLVLGCVCKSISHSSSPAHLPQAPWDRWDLPSMPSHPVPPVLTARRGWGWGASIPFSLLLALPFLQAGGSHSNDWLLSLPGWEFLSPTMESFWPVPSCWSGTWSVARGLSLRWWWLWGTQKGARVPATATCLPPLTTRPWLSAPLGKLLVSVYLCVLGPSLWLLPGRAEQVPTSCWHVSSADWYREKSGGVELWITVLYQF